MPQEPQYPDLRVRLTGTDGNVFAVIALVRRALRSAGHHDAATEFAGMATRSQSYDEVIRLAMRTVDVC
ncbi:hypothetical protein ACH4PU_30835 [Streptomyces sp. NPDC021100]|uniref:hypothetical protein n=1 Tax=Streptomyces sp. NPDC021100 TaxID=3365114 RepID=UPI00378B5472